MVKRLLRAFTAFIIVLRHDPIEAKEKIERFFAGIRG